MPRIGRYQLAKPRFLRIIVFSASTVRTAADTLPAMSDSATAFVISSSQVITAAYLRKMQAVNRAATF